MRLDVRFLNPLTLRCDQPATPSGSVLISATCDGFTATGKGPEMAYTLPADKQVTLKVEFLDAKGNHATVDGDPTWSPLGGTIAYSQSTGQIAARQCTGEGGNARIVVLRLKSGVRNVIANAWSPDFTADGRGLVFQSEQADPNDPTSRIGAPQYESSDLTGEPRFFYSRAWCAESAPCLTDVVAAPTSTRENPQGLFIAEVEGGLPGVWGYCVTSADAVNGTDGTGDVSGG